jgi:CTP synthase
LSKKIIFVSGGILSGLGKGITSASIASLLKHANNKVNMLKIDPYINVDPGTMSPTEHGEVFVTYDGGETDLDLGNYERFLDINLSKKSNFTTGSIYQSVINKERRGDYLGQTIQVIPHIVDEIKFRILNACEDDSILIVELGGTIGDIEGMPFLEAIRDIKQELKEYQTMSIHVTLIPYIKSAKEFKTKPTQHSIAELRKTGIYPDMLICRSEYKIPDNIKNKLSKSCGIHKEAIIEASDAPTIYQVPLSFLEQNILQPISKKLQITNNNSNMDKWFNLVDKILYPKKVIKIAFVGKYMSQKEAYKSLTEAFIHCGAHLDAKIDIEFIDSDDTIDIEKLKLCSGILVAGGFGSRGINGKIEAIKYARENNIPFLGICLGMQLAIVEFARNILGIKEANSAEFNPDTKEDFIYLIDNFINSQGEHQIRTHKSPMGGTMRLGEYACDLKKDSLISKAYGNVKTIKERHRHRYEVNPKYKEALENKGLIVSALSDGLIDAIELNNHKWFVGVQFHPEFTSHLEKPNAVIYEFIKVSNVKD